MGSVKVSQFLLSQEADVNSLTNRGESPLHWATSILQLNAPQTRMVVEMIQQMYPHVTFDVVFENSEILFVDAKTQNVIAGSVNGQINLYPNAQ